jgi:uncharacterized protein
MSCFVDTSGFLAVANPDDAEHPVAAERWRALIERGERLVSSNYVVVETITVLHHRYGVIAVRRFCADVLQAISVAWVDEPVHAAAVGALLAGGRRGPSLVDCASFEIMRREGISAALAFDRHFEDLGYALPAMGT